MRDTDFGPGVPRSLGRRFGDVEIVTGGAEGLADVWRGLSDGLASPMQSHEWAAADDETRAGVRRVTVIVGGRDNPSALATFLLAPGSTGQLRLAAHGEPSGFVYRDEESLVRLCAALVRMGLPLKLGRVVAGSPTDVALAEAFRSRGVLRRRRTSAYPVVDLDEGWRDPEQHFNAGRRSDVRRARRRAAALGDVSYELLAPVPGEVDGLLDEAYAVESAGWKGRGGTALAVDEPLGGFFRRWARRAASAGQLRMSFLRIGGKPVAMQVAAEVNRRLWLLKIGYDETVKRCSPGTLLMLAVVAAAADGGLTHVEFLGTAEAWTGLWATRSRECVRLAGYPAAMRSLPVLAKDTGRAVRRKLFGGRR
ncbi:GNAT family N-acetyltransferase [Pseudonocardia sp.]|uniref:GNAT family N-acetyltransferase n=1 Tax=Pseudonocardia sp. TaxID=60912 RepID=UPI003D0960D1